MKGVFDTRPLTEYDDDIRYRYHVPNQYLAEAERTVNDWIIYREPRRGNGREGYVAVARVSSIDADPSDSKRSFAYVHDYLEFDRVVPLRRGTRYYETRLASIPPQQVGRSLQGKSVRTITHEEFGEIVLAGLAATLEDDRHRSDHVVSEADRFLQEFLQAPPEEQNRRIAQLLMNRPLRDRAFRRSVITAYRETCAVTGLRIVNGGGRAEVQAAHIRAVQHGGPDIVQNGLALSATCHWLFDRHLISLSDDYGLLVAHNRVPNEYQSLFSNQLKRIHLPDDRRLWPHSAYIEWHRNRFHGD